MTRFVLIHHGGKPPGNQEARDRMMAAMGEWMEGLGDALVDSGSPLGSPRSIGGEATDPANGYMILEAADLDTAEQLASAMPMAGEGEARIDVHEALSMEDRT
ncbi:MAG: YciI family protein [bacterium]